MVVPNAAFVTDGVAATSSVAVADVEVVVVVAPGKQLFLIWLLLLIMMLLLQFFVPPFTCCCYRHRCCCCCCCCRFFLAVVAFWHQQKVSTVFLSRWQQMFLQKFFVFAESEKQQHCLEAVLKKFNVRKQDQVVIHKT